MHLKKWTKDINYYFLRLFIYSLFRPPRTYRRIQAYCRKENSFYAWRKKKAERNLAAVFGDQWSREEIERVARRYIEVLSCDEADGYVWFLYPWSLNKKNIRVEGREHIEKIIREKRGCVILNAHYGGGLFIFDFIKELGGKAHCLSRPISYEFFEGDPVRYGYYRFREYIHTRLHQGLIYTDTGETKNEFLRKLEEGYQIYVSFDVPPQFVKGPSERIFFLNRYWTFPTGLLELLSRVEATIVPHFPYLTEDGTRVHTFHPEFQVKKGGAREALERCAAIFEKFLRERPENWFFWDDAQVFWL